MAFVNHIDTNPHTRIVLYYISLNSGLWPNLPRKTAITITFYFPAEEKGVCIRNKYESVTAWATISMRAFCNTRNTFV